MFGSKARDRRFELALFQAKTICGLRDENDRLRALVTRGQDQLCKALDRIYSDDPSDHDWRAEASGLAYMICQIHDDYLFAKQELGGDSEILASAILNAYRWVDGPLRTHFEPLVNDGDER